MFCLIWFGSSLIFFIAIICRAISEYTEYGVFSIDINTITGFIILGLLGGPLSLIALIFAEFGENRIIFRKEDK